MSGLQTPLSLDSRLLSLDSKSRVYTVRTLYSKSSRTPSPDSSLQVQTKCLHSRLQAWTPSADSRYQVWTPNSYVQTPDSKFRLKSSDSQVWTPKSELPSLDSQVWTLKSGLPSLDYRLKVWTPDYKEISQVWTPDSMCGLKCGL